MFVNGTTPTAKIRGGCITCWDRLVKCVTYLALANGFGEYSGRPFPPSAPYLGPGPAAASASTVTDQAASAAVEHPKTVVDLIEPITQENIETTVEPGFVADVNMANVVYEIKPEVGLPTPAYEKGRGGSCEKRRRQRCLN